MSAIQFLREKAGVFIAGIIGFSLFLFVVSDFFGKGRGQRLKAKKYYEIGEIAGQYVSYQDFDQRVQDLYEIYKLSGTTNLDEATSESIREQVWEQMVREIILSGQYKKLGIGVSSEELDELVLGNNPHPIVRQLFTDQSTGVFNKSFLINFLKQTEVDENAKKYWMFFEDEIVDERENAKYNTFVSRGLFVTSKQAEFDNIVNSPTVDFSFIMKNFSSVPDSAVTISHTDLEAYYSRHKENYKRNALRDIEYVAFDVVPSEEDVRDAENWINNTKNEFAETKDPVQFINLTSDTRYTGYFVPLKDVPEILRDFVKKEDKNSVFGPYREDDAFKIARLLDVQNRPDSVHARHILLAPNDSRNMEQTKAVADSLVRLLKGGASFEKLARDNSADQGSVQVGGDLGWFPEGRMVLPFNNACFTAKKGQILTVETTYGIHIIEILATAGNTRKYNIGIIDRNILPSSGTTQKVYSEASQFAGTNDTYDKFNKAIAEQNLNKRVANDVTPQQKTLPGLDNPRSLIISLFTAEQGKIILDNSQQAVFEIGDKYVVAFCTKVQQEGIAPLKDVENEIRLILLKDKKADIISTQFADKIRPGETLDDLAGDMGLSVHEATQINFRSFSIPNVGSAPDLIAAASAAKEGVISGPVKGENGVSMIYVNSVSSPATLDMKLLHDRLTATFEMRGNYEAYEALRKAANIIDKRYKFY